MPTASPSYARAFPAALEADVAVVTEAMPTTACPRLGEEQFALNGEGLCLPGRLYNSELGAEAVWTSRQRQVLHCLYTRHNDGHVRERHARDLVAAPTHWTAPYLLLLMGEYVVEIVLTVQAGLTMLPDAAVADAFRPVLTENPLAVRRIRQRAASYWDCYYRWDYAKLKDYPGIQVLDWLVAVADG